MNQKLQAQKDPFDNDLIGSGNEMNDQSEADMDFGEEDEEEDFAEKEDEEEQETHLESAENLDIISELQMKQQEIALKKDGLLSTE